MTQKGTVVPQSREMYQVDDITKDFVNLRSMHVI